MSHFHLDYIDDLFLHCLFRKMQNGSIFIILSCLDLTVWVSFTLILGGLSFYRMNIMKCKICAVYQLFFFLFPPISHEWAWFLTLHPNPTLCSGLAHSQFLLIVYCVSLQGGQPQKASCGFTISLQSKFWEIVSKYLY